MLPCLNSQGMNKQTYLYGAGGHGKVVLEILQLDTQKVAGFFDDGASIPKQILGIPFLGSFKQELLHKDDNLIITVGNNSIRKKITTSLFVYYATAIHKNTYISPSVRVELGTVIMSGVSINASTTIGKHVIINTNASIDHDCRIGDFAHISPNACLSGCVTIGEGTHVGAGAVVIPEVYIGKWATIGAGAVITKDVPDYAVVVGNPGKIIKYTHE